MIARLGRRNALLAGAASAVLPATTRRSRAAAEVTVALTGNPGPADWPLFIALAKGYFAADGLSVSYVPSQSGSLAVQEVLAGSARIVAGAFSDTMHAVDRGARMAFVRTVIQYPPYTLWARPALKTFADLRGRTVIVGGAKDVTRTYLDRMMASNQLKGDYSLVYAGTTPSRYAALTSGAVDAAILFPPFSFQAEAAGFSLVGRLSDYVKDMPFTAVAVATDWAKANRPTVVSFTAGYQRGVDFFYQDANKAECVDILLKVFNTDPGIAEKTYDYWRSIAIFSPRGTVNAESIASLVKVLADDGDLSSPDATKYIDPEIASWQP